MVSQESDTTEWLSLYIYIYTHTHTHTYIYIYIFFFSWWLSGKESACNTGDTGLRRRKWLPTPVFLPGKSHGQRSLVGYSSWGCKESSMTYWLNNNKKIYIRIYSFSKGSYCFEGSKEESVPCLSVSNAFHDLQPHDSNLYLCCHMTFFLLCLWVFNVAIFFYKYISPSGLGALPTTPPWSILIVTTSMTLLPNKFTFWGTRG